MAIKLFINEGGSPALTDQTGRLDYNSGFTWDLQQGLRGTATIPLRTFPPDTYRPTVGAPLYIHEIVDAVDSIVWAGKIMKVDRKWDGNEGNFLNIASCATLDSYFDTIEVYPPQAYQAMTCGAILADIFNRFCSACPITLGTIEDGPTIDADYTHRETIRDVFNDLQNKGAKIWGIRNADSTLYYQDSSTTPAPHVLTTFQYGTGQFDEDQSDYRNEQTIRISFNAFGPSNEVIDGDGTAVEFPLFNRIDRIVSAMITNGVRASVTGHCAGSPPTNVHVGDTFTISRAGFAALAYTWVEELDNEQRNQVLRGATAADSIRNMFDAIMATPLQQGITFSMPTWQNEFAIADFPGTGGTAITLRVKFPGSGGNIVTVTTTSTAFVWGAGGCSGGTDGDTNSALNVSVLGQGSLGSDLTYVPGTNVVFANAPIGIGVSLSIAYYRSGADCITVRDSALVTARAAVEHGPGLYAQLTNDTNSTDARAAYIKVLTILHQFKTIPKTFTCETLRPLYEPGQLLTITVLSPDGASTDLDGFWLLQHLQARLEPGAEKLPEPYGHFFYTITVISVNQIGTKVAFWETLALTQPSGSQSVSVTPTITATPTLKPITSDGTPFTGSPTITVGQQLVQEQLGPATLQHANDLTIETDHSCSSASYTFVDGDVGKFIETFPAPGVWEAGIFEILSVSGGIATVDTAFPEPVSSTDGPWRMYSGTIFSFTWQPTKSSYTTNQIAWVMLLEPDGGSPLSYTTRKLTPFVYTEVGFALGGIDAALGGDYQIDGDQLTLAGPKPDGAIVIVEYFPSGPKVTAPAPLPSGTDLVLFANFGDLGSEFTSASYSFTLADVGKFIVITGGTGWTPGTFSLDTIGADPGGINTGLGQPADVGTTGGIWHLSLTG